MEADGASFLFETFDFCLVLFIFHLMILGFDGYPIPIYKLLPTWVLLQKVSILTCMLVYAQTF